MPGSRARCALLALVLLLLPALAHAQPRRLAIFELANRTGDPSLDWVGGALGAAIRDRLGVLRAVELLSPGRSPASRQPADALAPLLERARLVGADQLVLGAYSVREGRWHVEARIVDTTAAIVVAAADAETSSADVARAITHLADAVLDAALDGLAAHSTPGSIEPLTITRGARPELSLDERRLIAAPWPLGRDLSEALGLGVVGWEEDRWTEAGVHFERVTSAGVDYAPAWLLLGTVRVQRGAYAEAAVALERALAISRRLGLTRTELQSRYALAMCRGQEGHITKALEGLEETRRQAAAAGHRGLAVAALDSIATAHATENRAREAAAAWREALRLAEEIGDATQQAPILTRLASLRYRQDAYDEALTLATRAATLAERVEDRQELVTALYVLGLAEFEQGRVAAALAHLTRSAEASDGLDGVPAGVSPAEAWLAVGRVYLRERKPVEAQVAFERAERRALQTGSDAEQTEALRLLAFAHLAQDHHVEATSGFERALHLAQLRGDEPGTAMVLYGLAQAQTGSGREVDALVTIERALAIATRLGMAQRQEIGELREHIRARIPSRKG